MGNENLKTALANTGLTIEQLAEVIRVDPKSVQRWVTGTTTPYPRHRAAISQALNLTEHDLWPEQANDSASGHENAAPQVDVEGRSDVVGAWAYSDDQGAPDPVAFINTSDGRIDVFAPYSELELPNEIIDALATQAAAGRQVRILTDQPTLDYWTLQGHEHVQILTDEIDLTCCWLIRAGDSMLWAINLADDPEVFSPPVLKLRRNIERGLFDRLQDKFHELWELAHERDLNTQPPGGADTSVSGSDQSTDPRQPRAPGTAGSPGGQPPEPGKRRWPGRST